MLIVLIMKAFEQVQNKPLLQEFADLEGWLADMEMNMLSLDDLAIDDQDELAEQANLLSVRYS